MRGAEGVVCRAVGLDEIGSGFRARPERVGHGRRFGTRGVHQRVPEQQRRCRCGSDCAEGFRRCCAAGAETRGIRGGGKVRGRGGGGSECLRRG